MPIQTIISTYARLFIGLDPVFSSLVKEHSRQSISALTQVLGITSLSETEVKQSLNHPHNQSLRELIGSAYCDSIRAAREIIKSQESIDLQLISIEVALNTLDAKRKNASPAAEKQIRIIMDTLHEQYKLLLPSREEQPKKETLQDTIAKSQKQLDDLTVELDQLTTKHNNEWTGYRSKLLDSLRSELDKLTAEAGLQSIPEGEITNLLRQDLQELSDRYIDLGASKDLPASEMESMLHLKKNDFDSYFRMKAYLALRSVNPPLEARAKLMKKLDSVFQEAKTEGKKLFEQQNAEIKALDSKIVRPIIEKTQYAYKNLATMKISREESLKKVTSRGDLRIIEEKTQERISQIQPQSASKLHL